MSEKRFLRTKEAAEYLGFSEQHLQRLRSSGDGPVYSKPGKYVYYNLSDLDQWVWDHRRKQTDGTRAG